MATIPSTCKFHVVSTTVDTTDRGSAEFQSQRKVYTMADITDTVDVAVSPYKAGTGTDSIVPVAGSGGSSGEMSVLSGGCCNRISGTSEYSAIHGGKDNLIDASSCSWIGGGRCHTITTALCKVNTIVGGYNHTITGDTRYGFIGGGNGNCMSIAQSGVMVGGYDNLMSNAPYSALVGGRNNNVSGDCAFLGAGCKNHADRNFSVVVGGQENCTDGGTHNSVLGGCENCLEGDYSVVVGGKSNHDDSCACAMIVGSNITADRVCTTFVNNLSIMNIPVASAGLPSGAVWNNGGVLTIV